MRISAKSSQSSQKSSGYLSNLTRLLQRRRYEADVRRVTIISPKKPQAPRREHGSEARVAGEHEGRWHSRRGAILFCSPVRVIDKQAEADLTPHTHACAGPCYLRWSDTDIAFQPIRTYRIRYTLLDMTLVEFFVNASRSWSTREADSYSLSLSRCSVCARSALSASTFSSFVASNATVAWLKGFSGLFLNACSTDGVQSVSG